jgi:hypothetical protein
MTDIAKALAAKRRTKKSSPENSHDRHLLMTEEYQTQRNTHRQHRVSWPAFVMIQFLILLGIAMFYNARVVPKITQGSANDDQALGQPKSNVEARLNRAGLQILALQKQLDAQAEERERSKAQLQEMTDRLALVVKQSSFLPSGPTTKMGTSDASEVASMLPSVSPSTSELILLKERNRLIEYADKAIATGSRDDLQAIVDAMFDPAMKHLNHACQAEFKRVQNYYEYSISIDPGFTLPVQDIFKDGSIRAEADITPAQLTGLLQDSKQPWEFRLRSAYLLRASTDKSTNEILLKAIKEDPSLDVAKQAQTTFEKRVGRKFRLFDLPTIDAWWDTQKDK